ncbi:hypothetical protein VN12_15205 [Pirellula sp. SH-Sr6A]|uniref:hypothetical protein n=1 Tax=Pirellula sp. SH-Sr6A TaxID=1632865 RepID=UPI00078EF724|nr:hypothetical protein [Pirellula sp. SH-Sr6A]AMV33473.1 hypothetical protein VN12_15205 [Pirellula sp. SH-Sr6A]
MPTLRTTPLWPSLAVAVGVGYGLPAIAQQGVKLRQSQGQIGRSIVVEAPAEAWVQDEPSLMPPPPASPASPQGTQKSGNPQAHFLPPMKPIGSVSIGLAPKSKGDSTLLPENQVEAVLGPIPTVEPQWFASPSHASTPAIRSASAVPYQPLYFEEVNLERYGRTCGLVQPALSGVRFLATIPALPYAMSVHDARQPAYWDWPYEAGWPAPKVRELPPLQLKPLVIEGTVLTAGAFLIP